jgi:LAO/AO transport system kinase
MIVIAEQKWRELADRLIAGDVRALARAISLVENDAPEAQPLLSACFSHIGQALRIGITGAPGAGKSTLVDGLARAWRAAGKTVGVLAVDPTSPFTGGAILGDRIRMQDHAGDDGLYIRSMATRGALGGLARNTADVIQLLEASGKDIVLIETVGVGQDEIDIVRLADITVVVLVPGMGDDVQSIKAGIMEIADIFVVNKADREGADRVEKEIRAMQSLAQTHAPRVPPIVRTIATSNTGIAELIAAIEDTRHWLSAEGRAEQRRVEYWSRRIEEMVRHELLREASAHGLTAEALAHHAKLAVAGQEDPYRLVPELVAKIFAERRLPRCGAEESANTEKIEEAKIEEAKIEEEK